MAISQERLFIFEKQEAAKKKREDAKIEKYEARLKIKYAKQAAARELRIAREKKKQTAQALSDAKKEHKKSGAELKKLVKVVAHTRRYPGQAGTKKRVR
jgi:hypothetical protein